ncbi:hypothetical protein [Kumtagia ephedrae]|uniref:Flagellar protein n=1 Tax=Kumtagia ephedrae TaxID=2116701 RepID=A0A2P7SLJ2_9HYPH|nr:hypothetical protein [Mesorhizobium ephedrae]PSJ63327.1 hypothetical protein C7I84_06730 [Mesorhizobium ephedrae]
MLSSRAEESPHRSAEAARAAPARRWSVARLFRRRQPKARKPPFRRKRSDLVVAGLGIALGFGCAVFPWYIFFNQEKFGIRALKFEGGGERTAPIMLGSGGERVGAPMSADDIPPMQLDLFATGTVSPGDDDDEDDGPPEQFAEQPFPEATVDYRLVYAAAGRAMIADETGMWVVQRGSLLPDNSKVASIEQRGGKWVLVTSRERVVELSGM